MPFSLKKHFRKLCRKRFISQRLKELRTLSRNRSWIELEKSGRELISADPCHGEALCLVAYSLQQQGHLAESLDFARRAMAVLPDHWHSHFIAGYALKGMGRAKEACEYLGRAVAIAPDDAVSVEYLMEATAEAKGIRSVAKELERLRTLSQSRSWLELENSGRKLIMTDPCQGEVLGLVAYSLQQQGRLAEALEFARRAIEVSPDQWHLQYVTGYALKGMGRTKEACEYLRRAVAIAPDEALCVKHLIEAIAASDGVRAAGTEYAGLCRQAGHVVETTTARISTVREWGQQTNLVLLEAGAAEEIPFEAPMVWPLNTPTDFHVEISDKPYVADIAGARIFSHSSLVLTPDGTALSDTAGHPQFGRYVSFTYEDVVLGQSPDELLLNLGEFVTREIEAGVFLAGSASDAFGHWLPEFLPKLQFYMLHPDFASLPIIVDADMPKNHFEYLRRFVCNPLILLHRGESFHCQRLLVAPSPSFSPVEWLPNDIPVHRLPGLSPRALRFLQKAAHDTDAAPDGSRIFLARRKLQWRRLLNESEITDDLSELGFRTVYIEEMDVQSQIDLFRRAEWIVAPNGSALLNVIFSSPRVKLLILSQAGLFNLGTYQGPMRALGYNPVWLCGEDAGAGGYKHSDYSVSIQKIRLVLAEMGL